MAKPKGMPLKSAQKNFIRQSDAHSSEIAMVKPLSQVVIYQGAVKSHRQQSSSQGKTMVFTSTVSSAEEAAQVLEHANLSPLIYHRDVPQSDREDIVRQAASR